MKNTTLISIFLLIPFFLSAQIQYHSNDFAEPGATNFYSTAGAIQIAGEDFSQTGEDFSWDFTSLEATSQNHKTYRDADVNGFKESFIFMCVAGGGGIMNCIATWNELAYMSQTSADTLELGGVSIASLTSIYNKTDQALIESMIGGMIGTESGYIPVVFELEDHDTLIQFPIEYGQFFRSHGRYVIDMTDMGQDFKYTWDRETEAVVEGYGSLQLPWKSYNNVLKMKKEIAISDTIIVNGTMIENPINNQITYQWYDAEQDMVVMEAMGYRVWGGFEVFTEAIYMDTIQCLEPSAMFFTTPFFPALDPETETSEVMFNNLSSNGDSWEWDFGDPESGASNYSNDMNPMHIYSEAATYNVTLTTTNNSCNPVKTDMITIPVIVSDTVNTKIEHYTSGKVAVAPNPFSYNFTLQNGGNETVSYIISNINGRVISSGELMVESKELISLTKAEPGIYNISFFINNTPAGHKRLIKIK